MARRRAVFSAVCGLGLLGALTLGGAAAAANVPQVEASTPKVISVTPRVWLESGLVFAAYEALELVRVGSAQVPVLEVPASAAVNPEGISVIRGANHKIPRVAAGKGLTLRDAIGGDSGSVLVWYTAPNAGGGQEPHLRKVDASNGLAFDVKLLIEQQAGVAADGAGGAYVASHRLVAPPGEVWMTLTEHRTYRLTPTGAILWQQSEATAPRPENNAQHATVAAAAPGGVVVGYAIGDDDGEGVSPVILRRAADDGAIVFKRADLVAAAGDGSSGTLARTGLHGRVDALRVAGDGSVIATVGGASDVRTLVHLDASGHQRAAFRCEGFLQLLGPDDVFCAKQAAGSLKVARFGVVGGALRAKASYTFTAPAGWTITSHAGAPSGHVMVAGQKNGAVTLALLSPGGSVLATYAQGVPGKIERLHVDADYTFGGFGHVGADYRRFGGSWSPGTSTHKAKIQGL